MKVITLTTAGTVERITVDDARKLEALQQLVGGYVETISITTKVDLVINEEGKFVNGHQPNRVAARLLRHFDVALAPGDYIAGDAVLVGVDGEDWTSTPDSSVDTLAFLGFTVTERDVA